MGGAGALRYALAHPEVFGASIALGPAVYVPLPPADSSTRDFGAFGKGKDPFSEATYLRLNWPAALKSFAATGLESPLYIAVRRRRVQEPEGVRRDPRPLRSPRERSTSSDTSGSRRPCR
jgi:hypothetical protein